MSSDDGRGLYTYEPRKNKHEALVVIGESGGSGPKC
jgi:hypothetical protein